MIFQRAYGRNDHARVGPQSRFAAFDVDEFFRAEIRAETRFGHYIIAQLQRCLRRDHGVAAVGDIGERPAVDEGGIIFQSLGEIRFQRVL